MAWLDNRIPPPLVGATTAACMWGLSMLGPQFVLPPTLKYVIVGILALASLVFDALGIIAFRRLRTTTNPLKPQRASAMVTGGVYRVTRNPMYVGLGLLLLAWAVYLAALLPLAGPVAFVLYITRFQIEPEERALAQLFGDAYAAYAAQVRRWL